MLHLSSAYKKCFILILSLSVFFSLWISFNLKDRGHYTGDTCSGDCAWVAGQNFDHIGFAKLHYAPFFSRVLSAKEPLPTDGYYTHYPPGGDIIQGVLFRLGLNDQMSHHMFSIFMSFLGAFFAWLVLNQLFSTWVALAAWAVVILSPSFLFFADNFEPTLSWFLLFKWFFLFRILTVWNQLKSQQAVSILPKFFEFFVFGFLVSWFSLDEIPGFLILALPLYFIAPKNQKIKFGLVLMLAAPLGEFVGFLLHLVQNSFVFGSFGAAVNDMKMAFLWRSGRHVIDIDTENIYNLSKHLGKYILGLQWFFTLPMLFISILGWGIQMWNKKDPFWRGLFIASFVGTIFWQFFMRQHSMVHAFTYRHANVFIPLGFGLFVQHAIVQEHKKAQLATLIIGSIFIIHTFLSVFSVQMPGIKEKIIRSVLAPAQIEGWACQQENHVNHSKELEDAKIVIQRLAPQTCETTSATIGLRGHLCEFVLYWR